MWEYHTSVKWKGGEAAELMSDKKPTVDITPPPEFGGKEDRWSPEDLLVGAIESCMLLTLLYWVDKLKIGMKSYDSEGIGKMERTPNGLRFLSVDVVMNAVVESADDEEKMRKAGELAEQYCPVSAAASCPIGLTVNVTMA